MTTLNAFLTTKLCHINCTKSMDNILEKSVAEGLHFMLKNTRSSCDVILKIVCIFMQNILRLPLHLCTQYSTLTMQIEKPVYNMHDSQSSG